LPHLDPSPLARARRALYSAAGTVRKFLSLAVKLKLPPNRIIAEKPLWETALIFVCIAFTFTLLILGITFSYYSNRYKQLVDERMSKPLFNQTPRIYAAPREVRVGQKLTAGSIAQQLRIAGYTPPGSNASPMGTYDLRGDSISVHPGPQSYHSQEGATISFGDGMVTGISGDARQQLSAYELEPQLITSLSEGPNRVKRRLVTYNELPPALVQAVTSIEDKRFFSHGGVDYISLIGWIYHDLLGDRRYRGGASTLTMQLSRGIFLSPARHIKRKLIEVAITFQLEHRYTKQQIFEMYANEIPLGQQGSFGIYGFGEAAQAYFGKDVRQLDLAECALLAGMIQQPSALNPYHHQGKRAIARRNVVLGAMVENDAITEAQAAAARQEPLHLAPGTIDGGLAPYFIDIVHDQIVRSYGETQYASQGLRVYSSLDPDLQEAANEAVAEGMKNVDELVEAKRRRSKHPETISSPQVALVALNPHTGQVLALVGGRNYGLSQFNHAVRSRPTGSAFKPFVYAAAFNTSLAGTQLTAPAAVETASVNSSNPNSNTGDPQQDGATPPPTDPGLHHGVFTEVTMLNNDLTTFEGGYSPGNYGHAGGLVTARYALQYSLNNATVELAQMVGYDNVAALARDAGITEAQGTPAVALGAYGATPVQMAGAYTTFANNGTRIVPWEIASVRAANGDPISDHQPDTKPILDPRVAYLTTNMLQNVMNAGTAAGVRSRGFLAPAAGKTGTERDAWFAGYTSNLICVIWVGNDDYSDVKLQGAQAAVPIWAEFMKRAVQLPQYSDTRDFSIPQGVSLVKLDKNTNLLADPTCPEDYYAAFLDGTAPRNTCSHPNDDQRNFFQKLFGLGAAPQQQLPPRSGPTVLPPGQPQQPGNTNAQNAQNSDQEKPKAKKRGFFSRLFGGGKKDDDQQQQQDQQQQNPQ
jgi:penicillin-binding protein 1B